jgi:predicted nucleic acid-binding protein
VPPATNGMNDKVFIDSNILIYAHDADAKSKHEIAKRVLMELWEQGSGVLSMQVLQEFYVNVTRKIASPLPKKMARTVISNYAIWCVETTPLEISSAFQIEDESRIGFWDAMIIAAAAKSGAHRILSEDLNAGQVFSGVRIENPFTESQPKPESGPDR